MHERQERRLQLKNVTRGESNTIFEASYEIISSYEARNEYNQETWDAICITCSKHIYQNIK